MRRYGFKTKEYCLGETGIFLRSIEPVETGRELEPYKIEYSIIDGMNENGVKLIEECPSLKMIVYIGNEQDISCGGFT